METSTVLLVCILVTCSVWTVHGRRLEVNIDDDQQVDVEISVEAGKLPGLCWACKWALNKMKTKSGNDTSVEKLTRKLNSVCDQIGLLKKLCRRFVKANLGVLVEELSTTDDVRTICVNVKACKPKELLDVLFYPSEDGFFMENNKYP